MVIEEISVALNVLEDASSIVEAVLPAPEALPDGIRRALDRKGLCCIPMLPPEADEPMLIVTSDSGKELERWKKRVSAFKTHQFRFQASQLLPPSEKPYTIRFRAAVGKYPLFEDKAVLQLCSDGRLRLVNPHTASTVAALQRYEDRAGMRPDAFAPSEILPMLAPGSKELYDFAKTHRKNVGEVLNNMPYWILVSDAVQTGGKTVTYPRLVYPQETNGAVMIARRPDGKIALLRIFRHGPRALSLELPRGGRKAGETTAQTALREVEEEIGLKPEKLKSLGKISPDTSTVSGNAEAFQCDIPDGAHIKRNYEQIQELCFLTEDELRAEIARGGITDGYTLSAMCLFWSKKEEINAVVESVFENEEGGAA